MEPTTLARINEIPGPMVALAVTLLAAGTTFCLAPFAVGLAHKIGAIDYPNRRTVHDEPVPRLGGVAIVIGAAVAATLGLLGTAPSGEWDVSLARFFGLASAALIVFSIGILDDVRGLSVGAKFLGQLLAALLVVWSAGAIGMLRLPFIGTFELGIWGILLSLLWIVGITNAINLIDGLDGLASGIGLIIAISVSLIALLEGQLATALVAAALAGACLGFLPHNWEPASVFMGDSGSLTMGFLLAVLTHSTSLKAETAVAVLVPIIALGLPAIDTLLVMVFRFAVGPHDRLSRRLGRIFIADRHHLHHLLLALARKRSTVVLVIYTFVVASCAAALAAALTLSTTLGLTIIALECTVILFIRIAGLRVQAKGVAAEHRLSARRVLKEEPSHHAQKVRSSPESKAARGAA